MAPHTKDLDLAALFENGAWLQRLATHLAGGADGADDAVQETWIAAWRTPPERRGDLRPWLSQVMRNALRRDARTRRRRAAREEEAMALAPRAAAPGADALERLGIQRQVAELVTSLDEPYRTTIVMRYFDGKSAADIARALSIPEGTVRWRTKAALDRLRAQLDERHGGDRKVWIALMLPRGRRPSGSRPLRGGVVAASAVGVGALVALVVVATGGGRRDAGGNDQPPSGRPRSALAFATTVRTQPTGTAKMEGIVLDPAGKPVAEATVSAAAAPIMDGRSMSFGTDRPRVAATAVTGADGRFRLEGLGTGQFTVAATHERFGAVAMPGVASTRAGVELRLAHTGVLVTGQVLDEGGGPIPGARVLAQSRGNVYSARVSPTGAYQMLLPDKPHVLFAEASGYGSAQRSLLRDEDPKHVFRLLPGARVSGTATAEGSPLGGTTVRLIPTMTSHRLWEEAATTGADGSFSFGDLPAGEWRVLVSAGALVNRARRIVVLTAGSDERLSIPLEAGHPVRGHVRDGTGRAIEALAVLVTEAHSGSFSPAQGAIARALTDASGRFTIEGLPPGQFELLPLAPGYAGRREKLEVRGPIDVALVADARSGFTGVVLKADGAPAEGARVRASSRPAGELGGHLSMGRAAAGGRFIVEGLGAGEVVATAWLGNEAAAIGPLPDSPAARRDVTIKLARGATVSGVVRWDDGTPASGVYVRGRNQRPRGTSNASLTYNLEIEPVRTDGEGRFTVGPFLTGDAMLTAATTTNMVSTSSPRPNQATVPVTTGAQVTGIQLVVSSERERLSGRVEGPDGKPQGGVTIIAVPEDGAPPGPRSAFAKQSISLADGTFTVERLSRGTHSVYTKHPELADVSLSGVPAGASDLVVRVPAPARLVGSIVTRKGAPVAESFLVVIPTKRGEETKEAWDRREGSWDNPRLELDDRRGSFTVPKLAPGRYDITVTTPDGLIAQALELALRDGETKRLRLVAQPGATLVGRVLDAAGAPVAGASVWSPLPGIRRTNTTTDASGRFRLPGVLGGTEVRVHAAALSPTRSGARLIVPRVRMGETLDVGDISLAPPANTTRP